MAVAGTTTVDLAEFIRREGRTILSRWEARVRSEPVAHDQPRAALIDELPALLESIARTAEALGRGITEPAPESVSGRHAAERLEQGYKLAEVVEEYIELRACIFERLEELGLVVEARQSRQLHRALDHALRETARKFVTTHEKMLRALDRIAGSTTTRLRSVREALDDILHALRETAGADVDSVAVLLLDEDGRLHVRATIGLEDEEARGFSLAVGEGFAGTVAATAKPLLLRDAANDPLLVGRTIQQRGTRALYGVPLLDEGRVIGVAHVGSCTASDFSEEDLMLFRAMAERAATVILRAQFVETLERAARFREQFIGVLGHDLRSPLHAILGTANLLLDDEQAPSRLRPAHERIARSATRMERLIAQLLDFTRARLGGGFALKPEPLSLLQLARDVADEHTPRLSRRRLDVVGIDVHGTWDRDRLGQVLANLVGNAVQYSPDGSRIEVRVRPEGSTFALVEVWNEGPAIPIGSRLFEPFERATDETGGLGLGLYITHEIVRAHRGMVSVESDASGTTFTVRLPLRNP